MAYFDFSGLIDKYTMDFTVLSAGESHYNDLGDLVTDEPKRSYYRYQRKQDIPF